MDLDGQGIDNPRYLCLLLKLDLCSVSTCIQKQSTLLYSASLTVLLYTGTHMYSTYTSYIIMPRMA